MGMFEGFPPGDISLTQVPELLFKQIIPLIDDTEELKLTLFYFWATSQQEGSIRYLNLEELLHSDILKTWLEEKVIEIALKKSLKRGVLLLGDSPKKPKFRCVFPNSPQGRSALEALHNGTWLPNETDHLPFDNANLKQKNIFELYEENIGPLTPMIAEDLKSAQEDYPVHWIEDAIHTAIQSNVRNWRYVEAILSSWKKEGKHADTGRNSKKYGRGVSTGEFDEFIQH